MAVYSIKRVQKIPASLDQIWAFFSDAANLQQITPAAMSFHILSQHQGEKIYAGQIIEYTLKPLPLFRVYWMTEITHVNEPYYFVDEQRKGPYSLWHHQHHFKEIEGGVEMTDIVHYQNPLGILGKIANTLFVKNKLEGIFNYRIKRVEELFGRWEMESGE